MVVKERGTQSLSIALDSEKHFYAKNFNLHIYCVHQWIKELPDTHELKS